MSSRTIALSCASVLLVASSVSAQNPAADSLTSLQKAVACASPPILAHDPPDALHIAGSQDVVNRDLFGTPEVLVLSGGTDHDVKVNNLYYVRRVLRPAETINDRKQPHTVQTTGWVRVVSVNEKMALVSPEHTCTEMRVGDYLEPFVPPVVMEGAAMPPLLQSELNFDAYSRVLHGELGRTAIGMNEFATIDHGLDYNLKVGARFAVYRDLKLAQNPLKRVGEAVAVMVGPQMSVVRVTSGRDALFVGDVMVPRTSDGAVVPPPDPAASRATACRGLAGLPVVRMMTACGGKVSDARIEHGVETAEVVERRP
jgi:hypothetical protein